MAFPSQCIFLFETMMIKEDPVHVLNHEIGVNDHYLFVDTVKQGFQKQSAHFQAFDFPVFPSQALPQPGDLLFHLIHAFRIHNYPPDEGQ